MVLITGLPESGWSESDIVTLVQSFGTPSDIIMATQIGKVSASTVSSEEEKTVTRRKWKYSFFSSIFDVFSFPFSVVC